MIIALPPTNHSQSVLLIEVLQNPFVMFIFSFFTLLFQYDDIQKSQMKKKKKSKKNHEINEKENRHISYFCSFCRQVTVQVDPKRAHARYGDDFLHLSALCVGICV